MTVLNYAGLFLFDAARKRVLLLKRSAGKKLHPGLFSGVGGKIEPGETPFQCINREAREEVPQIQWDEVTDIRQRLTVRDEWETEDHVMHWFTGTLQQPLTDMTSEEGTLHWHNLTRLPAAHEMTPSAYAVLTFILALAETDLHPYTAGLDVTGALPRLVISA